MSREKHKNLVTYAKITKNYRYGGWILNYKKDSSSCFFES